MNLSYAEWKKIGKKEYILYDSLIPLGNLGQYIVTENRLVIAWVRSKGRGRNKGLQGSMRQLLWVMKISIIWLWWWFPGYIDMSKFMKSYTLSMCSVLYNNYHSVNLFLFFFKDEFHSSRYHKFWMILSFDSDTKLLNQH